MKRSRRPDDARPPLLGEGLTTLFDWLAREGLVGDGGRMDVPLVDLDDPQLLDGADFALAEPTARGHLVRRKTQEEMRALKERLAATTLAGVSNEAVWGAITDPRQAVRKLAWEKLPADALAFYRPFHYPPFDQWGIYLLAGPLLHYHHRMWMQAKGLGLYSPEVLMHLVLFEVFHHEFFHHMAESTATSLEIIAAAQGAGFPVYLQYRHTARETGFGFPHAPLEEALANAYARNALGFISRVKAGYRTAAVKSYQAAIEQHWKQEPPGYRDAGHYIGGDYVAGGAYLLAQMLDQPGVGADVPLSCLAKHLMPSGFSAFQQKPDIPTYLVGRDHELDALYELVPAPNEAYTQLFWPYDTKAIDAYVAEMKAREKAERDAAKRAREAGRGGLW